MKPDTTSQIQAARQDISFQKGLIAFTLLTDPWKD
jgi:hypothetical protein